MAHQVFCCHDNTYGPESLVSKKMKKVVTKCVCVHVAGSHGVRVSASTVMRVPCVCVSEVCLGINDGCSLIVILPTSRVHKYHHGSTDSLMAPAQRSHHGSTDSLMALFKEDHPSPDTLTGGSALHRECLL